MFKAVTPDVIRRQARPRPRGRGRLAAVALAAVMLGIVPATSQASATGYAFWGAFKVRDVSIPSGQLTHVIQGRGYHVDTDAANFSSVGNLCDSSMKFTYGNGRQSIRGNVHWGCSHVGQWKYRLNRNVPRGSACAELWDKNWSILVARQCHYVHG